MRPVLKLGISTFTLFDIQDVDAEKELFDLGVAEEIIMLHITRIIAMDIYNSCLLLATLDIVRLPWTCSDSTKCIFWTKLSILGIVRSNIL